MIAKLYILSATGIAYTPTSERKHWSTIKHYEIWNLHNKKNHNNGCTRNTGRCAVRNLGQLHGSGEYGQPVQIWPHVCPVLQTFRPVEGNWEDGGDKKHTESKGEVCKLYCQKLVNKYLFILVFIIIFTNLQRTKTLRKVCQCNLSCNLDLFCKKKFIGVFWVQLLV